MHGLAVHFVYILTKWWVQN